MIARRCGTNDLAELRQILAITLRTISRPVSLSQGSQVITQAEMKQVVLAMVQCAASIPTVSAPSDWRTATGCWLWAVDWRRRGSSDLLQSHFHIRVSCQAPTDTPPGGPGHRVGVPTCPCFDMHAICMAAIALACAHSQLTPRSGDTRKHGYSSTGTLFS